MEKSNKDQKSKMRKWTQILTERKFKINLFKEKYNIGSFNQCSKIQTILKTDTRQNAKIYPNRCLDRLSYFPKCCNTDFSC